MHTLEKIGIPEILMAVDDEVLTGQEVLDAIATSLKAKKTEIGALIYRTEAFGSPKLPQIVSFAEFHLLDEKYDHQAITKAWNSVVRDSFNGGGFAGVVVMDVNALLRRGGLDGHQVDLNAYVKRRSEGLSDYVPNYGPRADDIFRTALEWAGIDAGEWPKLRKY